MLFGSDLGLAELGGFLNLGGKILIDEIVENPQKSTEKINQVQSDGNTDSDSSSYNEEDEIERQQDYQMPVIYTKNYLEDEQERVVAYTEVFLPDTKKLHEKIRLYTERQQMKV